MVEIIQELREAFSTCSKDEFEEGKVRATKGKLFPIIFTKILQAALKEKGLDYQVKPGCKIPIFGFNITPDLLIVDQNNIAYIIEVKDYFDAMMFGNFINRSQMFYSQNDRVKTIALEMQKGCPDNIKNSMIKVIHEQTEKSYRLNQRIKSYSLLNRVRNSKNKFYLKDYSDEVLNKSIKELIFNLREIL